MSRPDAGQRRDGGVQSRHRALDLVKVVAPRGGHLIIGEIVTAPEVPLPTVHQLLRTLVDREVHAAAAEPSLRPRVPSGALRATASSTVGAGSEAVLARLVDALGETANLAVLSGSHAEYVTQVPSRHTMRMFTGVGRQVDPRRTGAGPGPRDGSSRRHTVVRASPLAYFPRSLALRWGGAAGIRTPGLLVAKVCGRDLAVRLGRCSGCSQ